MGVGFVQSVLRPVLVMTVGDGRSSESGTRRRREMDGK